MGKTLTLFSRLAAISFVAMVAHTYVAPLRAQSISGNALVKAKNNCLTSVAKTVGSPRGSLKVIRQTNDATGISTDVKVPKATAPWSCLTDRQGTVKDVYFKGSEGAL